MRKRVCAKATDGSEWAKSLDYDSEDRLEESMTISPKAAAWSAAVVLLVIGRIVPAESPLDEPGFKDATVRSELSRGFDEVYKSAHDNLVPNLTKMANQLRAKSEMMARSPGYVLGARLGELFILDFLLRGSSDVSAHNSAEEITDAARLGHALRREIRRRTEALSLSEEEVLGAIGRDFQGLLNRYDSGAEVSIAKSELPGSTGPAAQSPRAEDTPLPEFPPLAAPEFVKLKKDFTLVDSKGRDVKKLPAGKRLRVVSRDEQTITVDFFGTHCVIPGDVIEPAK